MNFLIKPAVYLMSRPRYSYKFALIAIMGGLPLGLTLYLLITEINEGIRYANEERVGLELARDHTVLGEQIGRHAFLALRAPDSPDRSQAKARIEEALARAQATGVAGGQELAGDETIRSNWNDLNASQDRLSREQIADQHLFLFENLRVAFDEIGEHSHLSSDSDVAGFHLAENILRNLPEGLHLIAEITVRADAVLGAGGGDINSRIRLAALAHRLKANLDGVNRGLSLAFRNREASRELLSGARRRHHIASIRFVNFLLEGVVYAAPGAAGTFAEYNALRTTLLRERATLDQALVQAMSSILEERVAAFRFKRNLVLFVALLSALLVLYLFIGFYLNVTGTVETLGQVADGFVSGELTRRYEFEYNDELSQIGASFNRVGLALLSSQRETDEILRNVDEGLFLIDPDHKIGEQVSARTADILAPADRTDTGDNGNLAHGNFLHILAGRVSEATQASTRKYLGQMFKAKVKEEFLRDLNPLAEVEILAGSSDPAADEIGAGATRHLSFKFNRINQDGKVAFVMATVRDRTEEVKLARQLAITEEKNTRAMSQLFAIIQSDPTLLREFITDAEGDLDEVNELLRAEKRPEELREFLGKIYRIFHSIKGNATIMNLDFIVQDVHDLEDRIRELDQSPTLTGADFLPITMGVASVGSRLEEVRELLGKVLAFQREFGGEERPLVGAGGVAGSGGSGLVVPLRGALQRMAAERGREVHLDTDGFDESLLPEDLRKPLRDILIQMLRNSLSHGLEDPRDRRAAGKHETGTMRLRLEKTEAGLRLSFRDDGRGIDLEGLKARAVADGRYTAEELAEWPDSRIARLIFERGVSTADEADELAGRGVGMDVIRDSIRQLNGQIRLAFKPGSFTEFSFDFPIKTEGSPS